ncbi:MAG TPA: hypothetical protein VIT92_12040 [Burkholderiaceae bacterium]
MNDYPHEPGHGMSATDLLRSEIAVAAARMIAEDGLDYSAAKRKAAKIILGNNKAPGNYLPDNEQVENEVRTYNALFFADTQPARLLHLRRLALRVMTELAEFNPLLTGAVLNGTAGEHSDIHLHLFSDSAKDVQIYLLNHEFDFEVTEAEGYKGRDPIEVVSFMWANEGIHLTLFQHNDVRGALKEKSNGRATRADIATVRALIEADELNEKDDE